MSGMHKSRSSTFPTVSMCEARVPSPLSRQISDEICVKMTIPKPLSTVSTYVAVPAPFPKSVIKDKSGEAVLDEDGNEMTQFVDKDQQAEK